MAPGAVAYSEGQLAISGLSPGVSPGRAPTRLVPVAAIQQIYRCAMEDDVHHGPECFHILILDDEFILIGPFVAGALGAINALIHARTTIPVTRHRVRTVPYRFRDPGLLGLRLFPVPGLRAGPRSDLDRFHIVPEEDTDV